MKVVIWIVYEQASTEWPTSSPHAIPNKFELLSTTDTADHDLPPYCIPKCISWSCLSVFTFLSNHILNPTGWYFNPVSQTICSPRFLVFCTCFLTLSHPKPPEIFLLKLKEASVLTLAKASLLLKYTLQEKQLFLSLYFCILCKWMKECFQIPS